VIISFNLENNKSASSLLGNLIVFLTVTIVIGAGTFRYEKSILKF
tara:strand:+ start:430 stop:564 length:135 start_codon:yes stop_codon:yes gene_type:complete